MSGCSFCKLAGTFGAIQIAASDQAITLDITSRNYDTSGHLVTDHAYLRLPVNDAIRLHAALAHAVAAAEDIEPRQAPLWSDLTNKRPYGWRISQ
jgi:hypothetical protein